MDVLMILNFLGMNSNYLLLFLLMLFEGQFVTIVASFLATMGYFNVFLVILVGVLADLTADVLCFYFGRCNKWGFLKKRRKRCNIGKDKLNKIRLLIQNHPFKGMAFVKLTPPFGFVGLFLVGKTNISAIRFVVYSIIVSLFNKSIYAIIGYFAGISILYVVNNSPYLQYTIPLLVVFSALVIFFSVRVCKLVLRKMKTKIPVEE